MINSLSSNTLRQYNCALKLWWEFCYTQSIDPYQGSIPFIIKFLTNCLDNGASYGSINTTRSALSLIMGPRISSDDRLKRFLKGVFRLKPPAPKYNVTWNPGTVLDYLASKFPNENLSLDMLTKKLVTILALTSGHRVQTLSLIKIKNIIFTSDGVQIKIPDIIKTSKKNSLQPMLYLKTYTNKIEICPVHTVKTYLNVTKDIRRNIENLILTFKRPYHNATSQSISRWIKMTLTEAGIDTSVFTAHSTRHAATSAANRAGLNIDLIRKTAGWSNDSATFARFYNRPLSEDPLEFSNTICNSINN